ncbi:MAG TPA: ethanolamine ammonia-lyase subunit EutC [Novimethylophilus sp.]|uniref:ethanolamine ammonia-lyase subunit EutC n=1 Tax=Novimethylophilus sp. TaxID=2137426 RepID=UPI002F3FA91A
MTENPAATVAGPMVAGEAASKAPVSKDPWEHLKKFTRARIALGRAGNSMPTDEVLRFGFSHAMARDAVHLPLDVDALCRSLGDAGFETLRVRSAAPDRAAYLLRPDLGRRLDADAAATLQDYPHKGFDLSIVVGDGLSSLAIKNHAQPLLEQLRAVTPPAWNVAPVVIATQARVALSDAVAEALHARVVVMLVGERPGLTSPDSLGVYITYAPRTGRQDAERNCISNVRPEGLSYGAAARKTLWLVSEAMRLKVSGIGLKDQSDIAEIGAVAQPRLSGE